MGIFGNAEERVKRTYEDCLKAVSSLSVLFSDAPTPYIDYRIVENLFCRSFEAENLARSCIAVDARIGVQGIGIKTFVENPVQKIAEFDKQRNQFSSGNTKQDALRISELRNDRMDFCTDAYAIEDFLYHYVIRRPSGISIHECPMDRIDTDSVRILKETGSGFEFTDGLNRYRFNRAKSTLMEVFDLEHPLDEFGVEFLEDPMEAVLDLWRTEHLAAPPEPEETLILPLYSERGGVHVPEKSGLNQWNAGGRARDLDEVYIPYPKALREKSSGFFPDRDTPFDLRLPDGRTMSAKVCQADGKAIMSNPNRDLGEWLLRDVLRLEPGQLVTLPLLEDKGVNSVLFTKHADGTYSVDFAYQDTA